MVWSKFDLGWPWLCLGGGLVLFAVMFGTDAMRSRTTGSRWFDPVWLSWLVVPMLMVHMFEEYGYDLLGGTYQLPDTVCKAQGHPAYPNCPFPTAHYPLVNLGIAWVAAPMAAWMARRNLVVGLSWYGLLIFNGLLHVSVALAKGADAIGGVVTGGVLFIPSFVWMVYACTKSGALTGKAVAISVSGGILAHIVLAVTYPLVGIVGPAGMLAADVFLLFIPVLAAGAGSKLLGPSVATA